MPPLLRRSPSASPSFTRIRSFSILTGRRSSSCREFSAVTRERYRYGGGMEPVEVETIRFEVDGGVTLEGDRLTPTHPVGGAVVCHPHPLYGGSRQDAVVDSVTRALVAAGWDVLRFDFRGAGGSTGNHGGGIRAAGCAGGDRRCRRRSTCDRRRVQLRGGVALSVTVQISRWITVAPVLSIFTEFAAAHDARPKTLIAAARPVPAGGRAQLGGGRLGNTDVVVVEEPITSSGAQRAIVGARRVLPDQAAGGRTVTPASSIKAFVGRHRPRPPLTPSTRCSVRRRLEGDDQHVGKLRDRRGERQVEAVLGAVAIHRREQDLPGTETYDFLGHDGIDASAGPASMREDLKARRCRRCCVRRSQRHSTVPRTRS